VGGEAFERARRGNGLGWRADSLGQITEGSQQIVIHGCQRCHLAACGDFDDRFALVGEGRNREKRTRKNELRIS